jgi:hypothetical protein
MATTNDDWETLCAIYDDGEGGYDFDDNEEDNTNGLLLAEWLLRHRIYDAFQIQKRLCPTGSKRWFVSILYAFQVTDILAGFAVLYEQEHRQRWG